MRATLNASTELGSIAVGEVTIKMDRSDARHLVREITELRAEDDQRVSDVAHIGPRYAYLRNVLTILERLL
jgi:hypothetical protein